MKGIEGHARIPPPGWEDIQAEAAISGITPEAALDKLLRMRAAQIAAEEADPMRNGWEPPIWHVADALLGFPYCNDQPFLREIKRRLNFTWEEFCERMRKYLKYDRPVKMLLILGGNRGSKSEYPAKRGMMMLAFKDNARMYAMHMSEPRSKRDQQPLFWKYMPVEWQIQTAGLTAYIKYKKKTGFAENSFITPNGSEGVFLNYMQDKDTALQGMEADMVAPDELIPADWVEDILLRLATRAGVGILTFTPINGYTPTVKMFCDGATVVRTIPAYLCPRDGGEPDEALSLNLTAGQYAELWQAVDQHRAAMTAQSEPEDVIAWIDPCSAETATQGAQRGRTFEELPRVMKCKDPRKAVVFFNPSDNPYGNPKEVIADLRKKARGYIRERFYGQAERTISVLIPKFNEKIHVIPASRIPTGGTNYFFYDPASDRNSFMSWFKRCGKKAYLYREWPGQYHIPGVGIPGPWAIPSGRKDGLNDGAKGEGQGPWGFGNLRYKFEMARLERWEDWRKWKDNQKSEVRGQRSDRNGTDEYPEDEELEKWDERNGANPSASSGQGEIITARFIDSRAASAPRIEKDRPVTLQTLFDEINVFFFLTPGADIIDGVSKINSALDYELEEGAKAQRQKAQSEDEDQKFINEPDFFVSEECENSIYALESWMNADGQNGACKDPIDLIRYFFMAECEDVGPGDYAPRGGVAYGGQHSEVRGQEGRIRYKRRRLPV